MNTDLRTFFTTLESLVDHFLSSFDDNVTIDRGFILRFPVSEYKSVYRRIGGDCDSLTLSNISHEEASELIPLFPNIDTLILEGMEFNQNNPIEYPTEVTFLKLSQCFTEYRLVPQTLAKMRSSLETINFDRFSCKSYEFKNRTDITWSDYKEISHLVLEDMDTRILWDFAEEWAGTLESVTFKNTTGDIRLPYMYMLAKLTIEDDSGATFFEEIQAPYLEHFSFKGIHLKELPLDMPTKKDLPLKTLEIVTNTPIRCIKNILKLKQLQTVKIHCEGSQLQELRNHFDSLDGIKSCDITSSLAPTSGYNLVHSVDADSLRKIFSYLPDEEMESISFVHPKFISLVPRIFIDTTFLESYPVKNMDFYDEIWSQVRQLSVYEVSATDFNEIMPHFKNLNALEIYFREDTAEFLNLDAIPSIQEFSLCMDVCDTRSEQWISLFRRLNRNLKRFDFTGDRSDTIVKCFNELTNLKEFKFSACKFEGKDFKFLQQNKSLTILDIKLAGDETNYFEKFDIITNFVNAKNIRSLTLSIYKSREDLSIILNKFENLEHLTMWAPILERFSISTLTLDKLTSVTILMYDIENGINHSLVQFIRHLRNLRRLRVDCEYTLIRSCFTNLLASLESEEGLYYKPKFLGEYSVVLTR